MEPQLSPQQAFGIDRKTGRKPSTPKPSGFALIDESCGHRRVIQQVGTNGYPLLVHIKKTLPLGGTYRIVKTFN